MEFHIYVFMLGFLVFGALFSYTDFRYGKIYNKHLLLALAYILLANLILLFTVDKLNSKAYFHYFMNSLFILIVSFILWICGLWTAGDAKLFFVLNLLVLPDLITRGYLGLFYGFIFFQNIFFIFFIYLFIRILQKNSIKRVISMTRKHLTLDIFLTVLVFFFGLGFYLSFLPDFFKSNFFIFMLTMFILFYVLKMIFRSNFKMILILLSISRLIIDHSILKISFWLDLLGGVFVFLFLRVVLLRMTYYTFTRKVRVEDLKESDFLAEDVVGIKSNLKSDNSEFSRISTVYAKKPIENLTFFAYLENKYFQDIKYDQNLGISKENLIWFSKNKDILTFKKIRIYETMHFAPLIFFGMFLTILVSGNFIQFIWSLFF